MPWHAKPVGGWDYRDTEGLDNAHMMFNICLSDGWTKPAIAAMLGNGAGESGLNPWRWEMGFPMPAHDDYVAFNNSSGPGYGLFQFTPSAKYILSGYAQSLPTYAPNFSDQTGHPEDGDAQMRFFINLVPNDWLYTYDYYVNEFSAIGIDITPFYISYDTFKAGGTTLENLVGAFECRWERPNAWDAANTYNTRLSHAREWLTIIQDWEGGGGGGSVTDDDLFGWLMLKRKRQWWRK